MAPRANWKGFLRLSLVTCPGRKASLDGFRFKVFLVGKDGAYGAAVKTPSAD